MFAYVNGKYLPADKAKISIADRGFRYGDGAFETIAIYGDIPYLWELHMKRLKSGLNSINIPFNTKPLLDIARKLIKKNGISSGHLRIYITRGNGSVGYMPLKGKPSIIIETVKGHRQPDKDFSLRISQYRKIPSSSLPVGFKLANSLNSILARMEADKNGASDSLLLDIDGNISETSSANIFWFDGDILYTPSEECDILSGTTRERLIKISSYKIQQGKFSLNELMSADEVFITNASYGIVPIKKIKNKRFNKQNRTLVLKELLHKDIKNYVADRKKRMG